MEQKETFEFERVLVSCLRRLSRRNTRETIVWVHGSFALLLSPLFSGHVSNPKREPFMATFRFSPMLGLEPVSAAAAIFTYATVWCRS